jgi:palmitoyltransferase
MPIVLAGAVGYSAYVTVAITCVHHLINGLNQPGAAIAVLVLYFLLFLLMVASYLRTFVQINFADGGLVPLEPGAEEKRGQGHVVSANAHHANGRGDHHARPGLRPHESYDVFVCDETGRPKWCNECYGMKPDRSHHSSELNRCVLRMDHYCPWAGGMISETCKFQV